MSSFEFVKVGEEWFSCQEKLAEDFHDQLECFCGNDLDEARAAPITLLPTKRKNRTFEDGVLKKYSAKSSADRAVVLPR